MMKGLESRSEYLPFGKPSFSEEEIEAVSRVIKSGWVGMGPETLAFESELSTFVGAKHVVAVNSCTSALFLSLKALGIGPGDEVIVPSLTWCSTANAVLYVGATPVLCDVELDTLCASVRTILPALSDKTKAVIQVHYGGLAEDMNSLRSVLPSHIAIVEDAAHALGGNYPDGTPVGSSGNLTCFSFYANKNLSTGDGGAISVSDTSLIEKVRLLSQQGLQSDAWKRFSHPMAALIPGIAELGYKMNFTDLQASIGRVQLKRQPEFNKLRLATSNTYIAQISNAKQDIQYQAGLSNLGHARHLFVIRLPVSKLNIGRNEIMLKLRSLNIGASIHYAPLHTFPLYEDYIRTSLPNSGILMSEIMTLPIGPCVTPEDAVYVSNQLLRIIDEARKI